MAWAPEGALKVWYTPQVGAVGAFELNVPDVQTGRVVLSALEAFSLFEYQNRVKPDYADAGGIARYESDGDGGLDWCDVDEEEV